MKIEAIRLTPEMASRKFQVLDFLRRYCAAHGGNPSLSEIAAACNTNKPRVQDAIRKLEREGLVDRVAGVARGVSPVSDDVLVLRQLESRGYIINPPGLALLDLDEDGRLTVTPAPVTKSSLPPDRARAHGAGRSGASSHGEEESRAPR